jgi:hypothetical protein
VVRPRTIALWSSLAVALALPVAASSANTSPPQLPACAHFSLSQLRQIIVGDEPLKFAGRTAGADICTYHGHLSGRYHLLLQIALFPGSKALFKKLKADAQKSAQAQHAQYHVVKQRNPQIISVNSITTDSGLPACQPHQSLPDFGPPQCHPQPPWYKSTASAYGTLKGTRQNVIVTAGIGAELGDVSVGSMVQVCKDILSGKLK